MELNQLRYPFAEQASQINGFVLKEKKKSIYCWTRSRPTRTFGESDDQVRDKSETIEKRPRPDSSTTALLGSQNMVHISYFLPMIDIQQL